MLLSGQTPSSRMQLSVIEAEEERRARAQETIHVLEKQLEATEKVRSPLPISWWVLVSVISQLFTSRRANMSCDCYKYWKKQQWWPF